MWALTWGDPVAAASLVKNERCYSTPAWSDLHQTALISTFWAMIRAPKDVFQMPLIMDVILNYSTLNISFFLDMLLLSSTNFSLHSRIGPIRQQKWKYVIFFLFRKKKINFKTNHLSGCLFEFTLCIKY